MSGCTHGQQQREQTIEWLRESTEHLDIFLFSAHHSMVFYFRMFCLLVEGECQIRASIVAFTGDRFSDFFHDIIATFLDI